MTSYAAFYVGRGENAEWIGTVRGDDIPLALTGAEGGHQPLDATTEGGYSAAVAALLRVWDEWVGHAYAPDEADPYDYSDLADLAYAFDDGQVWIRHTRTGPWQPAHGASTASPLPDRTTTDAAANHRRPARKFRTIRGANVDYRLTYYNTRPARNRAAQRDADRDGQTVQLELWDRDRPQDDGNCGWVCDGFTEPRPT
ncbi:hypothetical protein HFP15_03765 [Amycolatopsis sp. K13G38]|uniref:Uncharacterized protein n=1 Tax=Amycolatopsis acididurans TaxID=2724524 RepID=A0ABX1IX23_9PSEU|nr:hypothetical protein [Amycolatopsis acididurans]NKQ51994.1 hypothetical protein [Amycolatopsis acididurans]